MAVKKVAHKNFILFVLALAQFMVVLDVAIMNVALPSVYRALHFGSAGSLQWIVTAYTLAFGGFLLLGGRAADLYGRKKVFAYGVGLFTVASLMVGLAQNSLMMEVTRAVQGLAAAFMSPAALSIVLTTYTEGKERNRALSIWGAVAAGGAAAGVLMGGILTQYLNWRWNFFVNVPVGIFVIAATMKLIPESKADLDHSELDLPGAVLATSGLMLLVYGFVQVPTYGWTAGRTLATLATSLVLLVAFVINEMRTKHPLMPLSIFKIRNVSAANIAQLPIAAGLFGMFFFLTLYVQNILGYSPIKAGLSFLPITFIVGTVATSMQKIIPKIGFKTPILIGSALMAVGLFYLAHVSVGGSYWADVFPGLASMALGMGMVFVAVTIAATNGVPPKESGLASGLLNTAQQIGGSLGLAVLSAVAGTATTQYLMTHPISPTILAEAQVKGFEQAFYVAVGFAILALVLAWVLVQHKPGDKITSDALPGV